MEWRRHRAISVIGRVNVFPVLISHTRARVPTSSRSLIARSINSKSNRAPFIYKYISRVSLRVTNLLFRNFLLPLVRSLLYVQPFHAD